MKNCDGFLTGRLDCDGAWPAVEPDPTDAAPGSQEKIAVLQARAMKGENLFHPLDESLMSRISYTVPRQRVF